MAIDDLAGMAFGALRFLYRVGTFCISLGLFLIVVVIFRGTQDFGVIPFRLILGGFGIESSLAPGRGPRIAGLVLLLMSLAPTKLFLIAYAYLK